jgi:hypothetical protein
MKKRLDAVEKAKAYFRRCSGKEYRERVGRGALRLGRLFLFPCYYIFLGFLVDSYILFVFGIREKLISLVPNGTAIKRELDET